MDDLDQLKESGAEKVGNQSLIGLAKQTASLQDQLAGLKLEEYLGSEPVKDLKVSKFRNVLLVSPNWPKNQRNFCKDFCPSHKKVCI